MHPKEPARVALAVLPTPLVELKNLSRDLGVAPLWMKRDDLTGLELSGNKVRKLEYLIADALAKGCDTLVSHGGFQSNHCRATAAVGARLRLNVRLILRSPAVAPENDGNLFLDRLLGAHITMHPADEYKTHLAAIVEQAMQEQRSAGRRPYFFPVGASVPLGCWGYIRCMAELADQLGRDSVVDVYAAVSSSGTLAGMILGKALLGLDRWRVIGIPVSDSVDYFQNDVRALERQTVAQFGLDVTPGQTPIDLLDGYIGAGYALPYPAALETVKRLARTEGIFLDPTYTAKAMTGFLEIIQHHRARSNATNVFLHTGGLFGLMARRDLFPPTFATPSTPPPVFPKA